MHDLFVKFQNEVQSGRRTPRIVGYFIPLQATSSQKHFVLTNQESFEDMYSTQRTHN